MSNRFQITDTMVERLVDTALEDAGLDRGDWDGMATDHVMRLLRTRRQAIIAEAIVAVQEMRQLRPRVTDPAEQAPADEAPADAVDDLVQAMNAGLMADNIIENQIAQESET